MKRPEKNNSSSLLEVDASWNYAQPSGAIAFRHKVPAVVEQAILESVGTRLPQAQKAKLLSISETSDPAGHFCLSSGDAKWFLRISRRQRKDPMLEDKIVAFVAKSGIPVPLPQIKGLKLAWKGHDYLVYVFPFLAGRHYDGSDKDLRDTALLLKRLHQVLKECPFEKEIKKAALATASRLENAQRAIREALERNNFMSCFELADWAQQNREWLAQMSEQFDPYLCRRKGAQVVHGDFHSGNIMFTGSDRIILTDFEETPDAFFSPVFDVAYLVQRFAFYGNPSEQRTLQRLQIIKSAYGPLPEDLKEMMRQVCWYLIALIFDRCLRRESIVPAAECDKFVRLEKLTEKISF